VSVIDSRVINIDELKLEHFEKGDKFECDAVRVGPLLGAKELVIRTMSCRRANARAFPQPSRRGGDVLHRQKGQYAPLRQRDTQDPRGRLRLLPDRRPGNAHQMSTIRTPYSRMSP